MKKGLVLCGGVPQAALVKELKRRGVYTILADANENVVARPLADKFCKVSVFDIPAIKALAIEEKVDFLITACADQALEVVAIVAEELGLPWYIDAKIAENASKKSLMKKIFLDNGVPTTKFVILEAFDENAIKHLSYPLIVKPVDAYSSRGVAKVTSLEEAKAAFENAVRISRSKTAIIEEFFEGEEISVSGYVENGKAYVLALFDLYKIGEDGKFIINRVRMPSCASDDIKAQIADAVQKIATGFGLKNSPMIVQLLHDGKKINVVEFCARSGGGITFISTKKLSGFDVIKAVVDLTLGETPHVADAVPEPFKPVEVVEHIYCHPGELDHFEGFDELFAEGVITDPILYKQKGAKFGTINGSGDRAACFRVVADTEEEMHRKHAEANARIRAISTDGKDLIRHDLIEKYDA